MEELTEITHNSRRKKNLPEEEGTKLKTLKPNSKHLPPTQEATEIQFRNNLKILLTYLHGMKAKMNYPKTMRKNNHPKNQTMKNQKMTRNLLMGRFGTKKMIKLPKRNLKNQINPQDDQAVLQFQKMKQKNQRITKVLGIQEMIRKRKNHLLAVMEETNQKVRTNKIS